MFTPTLRVALIGLLVVGFGALPACDDDCPTDPGPLDDFDVRVDAGRDVAAPDAGPGSDAGDPDVSGDAGPECTTDDDCAEQALPMCQAVRCVMGACVPGQAADGTPCDDGDKCTVDSVCQEGVCTGGGPLDCSDGNPCTLDGCNQMAGCTHTNDNAAACDDGNTCTATDKCFNGKCVGSGNSCPEDCGDGEDNNGDGLVDCGDPKCVDEPACNPECVIADTLVCSDVVVTTLGASGSTGLITTWPCLSEAVLDGNERAWQVAVAEASTVTVTLPEDAPEGATLLHLADPGGAGCKPALCEGSATDALTFDAKPGETHYLVLDAPADAMGEIAFDVLCEACQPQCAGKQCGADGCGGVCGTCTGGSQCAGSVCKVPPANDQCAGALFVLPDELPAVLTGTTIGAADDYGLLPDSGCPGSDDFGFGQGAGDITYRFTPAVTGDYLIRVDSEYDSAVYVVTDCADITGSCVAAANVIGGGGDQVIAKLSMGVSYRIVVDGFGGGSTGPFTLTVNTWPCAPTCAGKSCGPDGCAGSCGVCTGLDTCTPTGVCAAPAPNETCDSATVITSLPFETQQSTSAAKDDHITLPEVCPGGPVNAIGGQGAPDVVYQLVAPSNGKYRATVTPQGAYDPILTVLSACPGTQQDCLGASDASSGPEAVEVVLSAGKSAWVVVDGSASGDAGAFNLKVEQIPCTPACQGKSCGPDGCGGTCGTCGVGEACTAKSVCVEIPANDTCGGATIIPSLPYTDDGATVGATNDYQAGPGKCQNGPASATYGTGPDVVYRYTAPAAQQVRFGFDLGLTDFITYLYVLKSCGNITTSTCTASAVSATPGGSVLVVSLAAGETIFVVVDGWSQSNSGNYRFTASHFNP